MIIVTGGCGFIGANLIHKLNQNGIFDIIIIDNDILRSSEKNVKTISPKIIYLVENE